MSGTERPECDICGDELPDPFGEGVYLNVETVDVCVRIRQPDRPHNNEVVDEADVCGEECADEYIKGQRSKLSRCYIREVDFPSRDRGVEDSAKAGDK